MKYASLLFSILFLLILGSLGYFCGTVGISAETERQSQKMQPHVKYLDELDLSLTECGWNSTQSRQSVGGNPLQMGGKTFERGVGHHPPGSITIAVPPVLGQFSAYVGIDDETKGEGHAEFLVYGDGELLWRSGFMVGNETPKWCNIPLDRISQLRLVVDEGPEGFGNDHTDWGDAKITVFGERELLSGVRTCQVNARLLDETGQLIDRGDEAACEFLALQRELATKIRRPVAQQAFRKEATFLSTDRDPVDVVLRRTRSLLEYLKTQSVQPQLTQTQLDIQNWTEAEKVLDTLDRKNGETPVNNRVARKEVFKDAVDLRRRIALQNPLLDFSDILFIKRHFNPVSETQGNHMCDQFFGFHARTGGGLFLLKNAFSDQPTVQNLLETTEIQSGRFAGQRLDSSWGFLAPELSFDAQKILFSAADTKHPRHSYTWTPENCYHVFETDLQGSYIKQITDGPWNDIDPCFLPNGRVTFISERRGGYGRCHGRPVPSYTLHSMNGDGTDIVMLSPHETNEWKPSVDHNGMILYTRWDYVDRGFNQAHHPWITTPDGRDSRSIHGNFSPVERSRPQFEATIRAIPNSQKLIAIAAMHHGQYFGSIVIVDPNVIDDDAMGPVRRFTPEQLFPEVENRAHHDPANYGQPFPLSEDFCLCVYDPFSGMGEGPLNNYGIYLLDSFGNRTLLYRDVNISSQCPIPVKSRPVPPVIPNKTLIGRSLEPGEEFVPMNEDELPKFGIVGLSNVYHSLNKLPEETIIKELRIVQLLPKTTPYAHNPAIGYGDQKSARAILGTVPVEEDGSAYFQLPVDIPVYFQAIDQKGLAIQTMRSATYVKPGEELFCIGCHEGRHRTSVAPSSFPTAFLREPSVIEPDVDGTKPFSYPRLVQPIWDRHCVDCHEKESQNGKTFSLGRGNTKNHFSDSFNNLRPYVFYYNEASWTESKSIPGQFGTYASKLWKLLEEGHYGVELTPEEKHRISVWMDNNGDFYGSYENTEQQRRGEIVQPTLE